MRSKASTPNSFHENDSGNESTLDTNDNQQIEKQYSLGPNNKLVFTTTSTTTTKSVPYWTVTDRQPEWYKLSIPINQAIFNSNKNKVVPYKKVPRTIDRNQSKSNNHDEITVPR